VNFLSPLLYNYPLCQIIDKAAPTSSSSTTKEIIKKYPGKYQDLARAIEKTNNDKKATATITTTTITTATTKPS